MLKKIPFYYLNKYQNPLMQRFLVLTVTYTLTSSIIVFMEVAAWLLTASVQGTEGGEVILLYIIIM